MRPTYSPRIPMIRNCTVDTREMARRVDVHPGTTSLAKKRAHTAQPAMLSVASPEAALHREERRSGMVEKEVMPSTAKRIILPRGYLVCPAKRPGRTYVTAVCLNPTQTT